ncbi:CehA/McbA family metallohydrolase [Pseudomonas sp. NPDC087358]|uniref:CehA/McbA family metallohydrolase n=1 Tax=Pseudomonas sp. NPDC087358 TaxID=3364439 RepID=UPI00384DBE8A
MTHTSSRCCPSPGSTLEPVSPLPPLAGDYQPLDLSALYNRATDLLEDAHEVCLGERVLHGLPFRFADAAAPATLLLLQPNQAPTRVDLARHAQWLIFAHALLETDLYEGGPVGMACAHYTLHYSDGSRVTRPVRQRFEIGPTPRKWEGRAIPLDWGQTPFLALNDAQHQLMDRCCGRYDAAGARLVEVEDPQSRIPYVLPYRFYLWPMENPEPEKMIDHLELHAAGRSIIIGAITTSQLAEDPFGREVSRDVLLQLHHQPMDEQVQLRVDRGFCSYAYRLAGGSVEEDSHFPKAWGAAQAQPHKGYVRVTSVPSGTLSLYAGSQLLGHCRWQTLLEQHQVRLGEQATLRLAPADRTWVRTRFVDADTGQALTCRVHMRTPDSIPVAPYSHHAHINADGNTWNLDIGGDVRLGAQTYAYINGECEGWLPVGPLIVEAARGFEYEPFHQQLTIAPRQTELLVALKRVSDIRIQGYYSGDTHVHFISTQGAELEARGEDVNVVNLLLSQWGHLYTSTEEFTGQPHASADGNTVVFACQENRTNMLGHMNLLGLRKPIMPWCTGGAEEADLGGGLETSLSHWADECRAQGGTVILAHFPVPNGEAAALIATQRIDAVEMIAYDDYNVHEYYRYLNAGYQLPLVGGTDKMTSEVPIGLIRTYAHCAEGFDYWSWCEGVRNGNTFVSSGPLLTLTAEGVSPGGELLRCADRPVAIHARVTSIFPIDRLEIVVNGVVVAREHCMHPAREMELEAQLPLTQDSWVIARCYGPGEQVARHHDVWRRPVMAHTSPIYLACGDHYQRFDAGVAQYMLALIEGCELYVTERSRRFWPGGAHHRHGQGDHLKFLLEPFAQARAAVLERIAQARESMQAGLPPRTFKQ